MLNIIQIINYKFLTEMVSWYTFKIIMVQIKIKDFMEKARNRWAVLGLPALNLSDPWHGYPLTDWTEENTDEAEKAVTGRYFETGKKLAGRRKPTD